MRGRALAFATACVIASGAAFAASIGSESSVALVAEYNSNPFLVASGAHAAESAGVQANLPVSYSSDTLTFDLIPRARYARTHGEVSLLSNYTDLDGDWNLRSERSSYALSGGWHRDSTIYNVFENAALAGRSVYRTEETPAVSWRRVLNERSDLTLSGSWDRVTYGQGSAGTLGNFDYGQASLQYQRSLTERWSGAMSVGYGQYRLRDQSYRNDNRFAQLSLNRALTERWSLTLLGGYSYLRSRSLVNELFCPVDSLLLCELVPSLLEIVTVPVRSAGGTASGALTFERRSERGRMSLSVSRAIQPSGFGTLVTQDDASLGVSYDWSERCAVSGTLHAARISDPLHQLQFGNRRYYNADLGLTWLVTEHWTLDLRGSFYRQQFAGQQPSSVTVGVTLSRQFGRLRLD